LSPQLRPGDQGGGFPLLPLRGFRPRFKEQNSAIMGSLGIGYPVVVCEPQPDRADIERHSLTLRPRSREAGRALPTPSPRSSSGERANRSDLPACRTLGSADMRRPPSRSRSTEVLLPLHGTYPRTASRRLGSLSPEANARWCSSSRLCLWVD